MERTHEVQILYVIDSSLNLLIANKQTTAVGRHGIVKGSFEINWPRNFKNVLILKWNLENVLLYRRGYAFISTDNERSWVDLKLKKIRFDWGKPPKNPDYRYKDVYFTCSDIKQKIIFA